MFTSLACDIYCELGGLQHTSGHGTQKIMYWPYWVGNKWLSSKVLSKTEGKIKHEIDRPIVVASAVLQALHCTVLLKIEQHLNVKLLFTNRSPSLTYGHELWVVTERKDHGKEWLLGSSWGEEPSLDHSYFVLKSVEVVWASGCFLICGFILSVSKREETQTMIILVGYTLAEGCD